jgi:hypothetical protein
LGSRNSGIASESFPLPFKSLHAIGGEGRDGLVVGAMFTADYADKAKRLAESCRRYSLSYDLHEVATVHRSLSVKGSDDLSATKANFIHHLLRRHNKPVLYLDADCEFKAQPELIFELARARCDFAIYNWLADEYTDRFRPINLNDPPPYRYFCHAGSRDFFTTRQLMAAGLTQLYGNSRAARALLARWHRTVAAFPGCGDDNCLNYTYNNLGKRDWLHWVLKTRWLPKEYARCMFWIYVRPVIDHADMPSRGTAFAPLQGRHGRQEFYWSLMEKRDIPLMFPRDCIIDAQEGFICKLVGDEIVAVEKTPHSFWI